MRRFVSVLLAVALFAVASALNDRPVIGMWTHPDVKNGKPDPHTSVVNAHYVKWLEDSAVRMVAVHYNSTREVLKKMLGEINGLVLPGGGDFLDWEPYASASQFMFDTVLEMNDAGTYFPLWATCLGFQQLTLLATHNDSSILTNFNSSMVSLPMRLTPYGRFKSRMLSPLPSKLLNAIATEPLTDNYHHWGVSPSKFVENKVLGDFYHVLATSIDGDGKPFVAAIEAKAYPIFGVQFHPERTLFEWDRKENIYRGPDAIELSQLLANFYASETRRNSNTFPKDDPPLIELSAVRMNSGDQYYYYNH